MSSTKSSKKKRKKTCADYIRFYLTGFFIILASVSSFTFVFLVPFVIDPGFATLSADLDTEALTCVTVDSISLNGTKNCTWSSCREGCTRDVYKCTQITVNYFKDVDGILAERNLTDFEEIGSINWQYEKAKIFPNIQGCGYPPATNCTIFNEMYEKPGTIFPCYFSKLHPNVTITQLDIKGTKEKLVYAIVIPWGCFITSILYLLCTYVGRDRPDDYMSTGASEMTSKESKESKEMSSYSLKSYGKSGIVKLRKDNTSQKGPRKYQDFYDQINRGHKKHAQFFDS